MIPSLCSIMITFYELNSLDDFKTVIIPSVLFYKGKFVNHLNLLSSVLIYNKYDIHEIDI